MNTPDKNLYEEIFNIQVSNSDVKAHLQETWTPEKVHVTSSFRDESNQTSITDLSLTPFYDDYDENMGFHTVRFQERTREAIDTIERLKDKYSLATHGPAVAKPALPYRFNEDEYIDEAMRHIDATYSQHYSGEIQATEVIIDAGHGTGFNIGNIIKYAKRYGKKNGYNRADILKIIHYATMQLYVHDKEKLG